MNSKELITKEELITQDALKRGIKLGYYYCLQLIKQLKLIDKNATIATIIESLDETYEHLCKEILEFKQNQKRYSEDD